LRVNERIFAKQMRLIGPEGEQLGVVSREEALRKAKEAELDLVEVAPGIVPPVCKIIDFAKYRYDQEKKEREARKHQKGAQLKEVRFRPHIEEHDYQVKLRQVQNFLEKGHKVRLRLQFRGREMEHQEIGRRLIERILKDTEKVGKIDKPQQMFGRMLLLVLTPVK